MVNQNSGIPRIIFQIRVKSRNTLLTDIGKRGYVYIMLKFSYLLGVARHPSSLRPFSLRQALPKGKKIQWL